MDTSIAQMVEWVMNHYIVGTKPTKGELTHEK